MKGSSVKNIKFDSTKQKIANCIACGVEIVVGKFAKKDQKCVKCKNIPKGRGSIEAQKDNESFGQKFISLMNKLGFTITDKRLWKKKYAIDGGGIVIVHPMIERVVAGEGFKLEYISMVVQRAIGLDENFRKFLPPDAASDCELLVSELGIETHHQLKIGQEKCDMCGAITDEFGVDTKSGRLLCIKPHNCFKKQFVSHGAQAEE